MTPMPLTTRWPTSSVFPPIPQIGPWGYVDGTPPGSTIPVGSPAVLQPSHFIGRLWLPLPLTIIPAEALSLAAPAGPLHLSPLPLCYPTTTRHLVDCCWVQPPQRGGVFGWSFHLVVRRSTNFSAKTTTQQQPLSSVFQLSWLMCPGWCSCLQSSCWVIHTIWHLRKELGQLDLSLKRILHSH